MPLMLVALLVSYSRIYVGVHYPLDVFMGALLGGICGMVNWEIKNQAAVMLDRVRHRFCPRGDQVTKDIRN